MIDNKIAFIRLEMVKTVSNMTVLAGIAHERATSCKCLCSCQVTLSCDSGVMRLGIKTLPHSFADMLVRHFFLGI